MISIAVHTDGILRRDTPPSKGAYLQAYKDLGEELAKRGAELFMTKEQKLYRGHGIFDAGWLYDDGQFVFHDEPFTVDVIFNKDSGFEARDIDVINTKEFDVLCNDKAETLKIFADLFPPSVTVKRKEDLEEALKTLHSEKIVLKPEEGFGGKGILIAPHDEILQKADTFPCIAQEYIDTEEGIPGVIGELHDFRIIIINGTVVHTFTRTPKKGNQSVKRGKNVMMPVPREMRPQGALELVPRIDGYLQRFGKRMYSIDCARNKDGRWLLIELNAPPGQHTKKECGEDAELYFGKLCELLLGEETPEARIQGGQRQKEIV